MKSAFYKTYGQHNCLGLGGWEWGEGVYSRESVSLQQLWPEESEPSVNAWKWSWVHGAVMLSRISFARRECSKGNQGAQRREPCSASAQVSDTFHGSRSTSSRAERPQPDWHRPACTWVHLMSNTLCSLHAFTLNHKRFHEGFSFPNICRLVAPL